MLPTATSVPATTPAAKVAATPAPAAPKNGAALPPALPKTQPLQLPAADSLTTAIRRVADARKPAVVLIVNLASPAGEALRPTPEQRGIGSGVIFDPAGFILTNNHVVEGAQSLRVVLPDNRSFTGRLIGRDPQTDLAVVKIDGDNLPVAPLAPSLNVAVGDWVVAIGNALGLPGGPTVTAGIVGALGRTVEEPNGVGLQDMIQTDAAINPGNSGGPLLNLAGEVVGINTAGIQGASGLGFAVSIDTAREVVTQLITNGRVIRPFMGVSVQTITPGVAARFNLPREDGVLIAQVGQGSPADRAGLRQGDIIIAIDGQPLKAQEDLRAILAKHKPGDTITIAIQRGNNQGETQLTLGEAPRPS
jgi:S1-C subfamily serine protease